MRGAARPQTPLLRPGRSRRVRRVAAAVAAGAAVLVPATGAGLTAPAAPGARPLAGPQAPAPDQAADDLPPGTELPELHPRLEDVRVSSPRYNAAVRERDRAQGALEAATREREEQAAAAAAEALEVMRLTGEVARLEDRVARLEAKEARFEEIVRQMAVARYVGGGSDPITLALDLDTTKHMTAGRQRILSAAVSENQQHDLANIRWQLKEARAELRRTRDALAASRARLAEHERRRDEAAGLAERAGADLMVAIPRVDRERRTADVVGLDMPLVVLDAYVKGEALMAGRCGIPWWALAGIGKTESGHATAQGAQVRADGSLTKPIVGIPLTGGPNLAYIGDSDGGAIDGDPTIDRAAGPMQFIPSTWRRWAEDGDGDGDSEAQNIYDAAASAAAYLCAGGPIRSDDDLRRAFFSYNHWDVYVMVVLERSHGYRAAGF